MTVNELISELTPREKEALTAILHELKAAKAKHGPWPTDPVHAAAVLAEEAGETVQAALDWTYENWDRQHEHMLVEAAQTGAMAVRMIAAMYYVTHPCLEGE